MRMLIFFLIITCAGYNALAQDNTKNMDTLSYGLGMVLADNLKKQGFEAVNVQALSLGIADFLKNEPAISMEEANKFIESFLKERAAKQLESKIKEGREFLEQNAAREEVTVTPSGLQYEVLVAGDGPKPSPTDKVTTHYVGMLIDGTEFDNSIKRGQPATFPINGVIKGWQEALPMMPVGSKWKIYVPYDLGYGDRGAGNAIPPYAALIFEIELIDIAK